MNSGADTIFVSYARENGDFAWKLVRDLRDAGIATWFDQTSIHPGRPWDIEVEHGLKSCAGLVVVLTPDSVESREVRNEVNLVYEDEKPIIPMLLRECEIPYRWRTLNWIDFTGNYDEGFTRLVVELGGEGGLAEDVVGARTAGAGDDAPDGTDEGSWGSEYESELADALLLLMTDPGAGDYLIASVGEFYAQFAKLDDDGLAMEIVGQGFVLPKKERTEARTETLAGLGFDRPDSDNPNFHQEFTVDASTDFMWLAQLARQGLATAYGVAWDAPFEIELGSF